MTAEAIAPRAGDILAREVPYGQAIDFVSGCQVFADVITKQQPDIIFFPQRGAGPIEWTTGALMRAQGQEPPLMVDLPIGTHIPINDPRIEGDSVRVPQSGLSGEDKQAIIEDAVAGLADSGLYIPGKTKLMLIDEVQKGGTISQAAHGIRQSMLDRGDTGVLSVVAAQDSRHGLMGSDRKPAFRSLVANERKGIHTIGLPISLFMVDRPQFLDEIWKTSEGSFGTMDEFLINENPLARRLFKTMVDVYLDPARALAELELIEQERVAVDIGSTILHEEILDTITDPREVKRGKQATTRHLMTWWRSYAKAVEKLHLPDHKLHPYGAELAPQLPFDES